MIGMKHLMNSRPFAALCLAVVILLSVVIGGFRSVKKLEKKAYQAYFTDFAEYGEANDDMKKMNRYVAMLYALCEASGCADERFAKAADEFDKTVGEPYMETALYEELFQSASLSYNILINNSSATDQQKTSAKQYYYEIDSIVKRLSNNAVYNNYAIKYNKAISSYPVKLFMRHADDMIVFD